MLFLFVPMVAAVALLVAGIVAATLMLSSVNERVAEIGLRRAVGARPEDIRLQFATETGITILTGGLGGLLLGYAGARFLAERLQLGEISRGKPARGHRRYGGHGAAGWRPAGAPRRAVASG